MTTSELYRALEEGLEIAESGSPEEITNWYRQRFEPLWRVLYPVGATRDAFGYDCDRVANNISYISSFPQKKDAFLREAHKIFEGLQKP
ncbi:MAG: hypothetical protein HYT72_04360 [Candidatus Aenigmarchaeota archaeon]|nr:hypothetical protein [Candidatus Aenigmarchaeota archaeon]